MRRTLSCFLLFATVACARSEPDPSTRAPSTEADTDHAGHDQADPGHDGDDHGHAHAHGGGATNLLPATEPCPGPEGPIHVRVLDSPELGPDDPVAFVREPEIHWIVALAVVEVIEGEFSGERLGVLVHSPSMFAGDVWGFGASPQQHPAGLELRWTEEFCMFEVVGVETPKPEIDRENFRFEAPQVHSAIIG